MPESEPELRPRRAGLDVETQQRIIELYSHRGASLRSVAAEVYVHPGTVHNILKAAGVPLKPRGGSRHRPTSRWLSTEQLLEVGEMYATGMSLQAIADEIGIARTTVIWRLRRLGYVKRSRTESGRLGHQTRRRKRSAQT